MKIYRIHISSWTASFRYPNMISGFQPTLPVPPLSTINGLISAAMGHYFVCTTERIGFVFLHNGKAQDLETIYQMGASLTGIKSNVIKREFLFDTNLFLYTDSEKIANALRRPYFQLLLGRSGDLAQVNSIEEIERSEKDLLSKLKGTILPFRKYPLPAAIQALPVCFSDEIPRRNIGTQPYCLLPGDYLKSRSIEARGIQDEWTQNGKSYVWDVYWQEF